MKTLKRYGMYCAVAAAVLFFASLMGVSVNTLGFNYDQCWDPVLAIRMLHAQPYALAYNPGLFGFNERFPCILGSASVKMAYPLVAWFAIFGAGPGSYVGFLVCCGVLAVVLTYYVGRALFGRAVGALAAVLLATDPSFFIFTRLSGNYSVALVVCALASILALLRFKHSGRAIYWYAACFILGMGADIYLVFWGFIGTLVIAYCIFRPRLALSAYKVILGALAFCAGMPFFLYYFYVTKFLMLGAMVNGYTPAFSPEPGTRAYAAERIGLNIARMADIFFNWYLRFRPAAGSTVYLFLTQLKAQMTGVLLIVTLWYAAALRMGTGILVRSRARRVWFVIIWGMGAIAASMTYIHTSIYPHLINIIPCVQLLMAVLAVGAVSALRNAAAPLMRRAVLGVLIAGYIGVNIYGSIIAARDWKSASRSGHGNHISRVQYELTDVLLRRGERTPYIVGWGSTTPVQLISVDRIRPREIRCYPWMDSAQAQESFLPALAPHRIFVFVMDSADEPARIEEFLAAARANGYAPQEIASLRSPDGSQEVYRVYGIP